MASKNVIIKRKIENEIFELFPKTSGAQVEVTYGSEVKDLAAVLATVYTDIESWNTFKAGVDFAGEDSALDTLRELIDMLSDSETATSIAGELAAIKARVAALEAKDTELAQAIDDAKTAAKADYNANKALIEGLRTDVDAKVAQTAYDTKMASLDEKDAAHDEAIAALQAKDAELVAEDARLAGLISKNAEDIAANAGEIGDVKETISTIQNIQGAQARVIVSETIPEDLTENDLMLQII